MSRLSKNIIYNILGQGLTFALLFLAVKYIFKQLGEDALGIIFFTNMVNALVCGVLEMGLCSATVREVSVYFEKDPGYIRALIQTFSTFYWAAYILLGIGIFFLAPVLVNKWINLKSMDQDTAIYILRILGITSLVVLPKAFYVSLLRGLQRMEFINYIDVAITGMQQLGIIIILSLGGNLFHVAYWFGGCYVLGLLTIMIIISSFFSFEALIPGYSFYVIKRNLIFVSKLMFVTLTGLILVYADRIVMSKLLTVGIFGYYSLAYSVVVRGKLLADAISQAAYPSFSALHKSSDRAKLMAQYKKLQELLCFGTAPIFAGISFAALPVFSYSFNEEIARLLLVPTILLCMGFYLNATLAIPYYFILSVDKVEILVGQRFLDLLVSLPATILLVYYKGLIGAGLSVILFYLLYYIYTIPKLYSGFYEIFLVNYYLSIFKNIVLVLITFGGAGLIIWGLGLCSIYQLVFGYVGSLIVYLIGTYFLISCELRSYLINWFRLSKQALANG